MTSLDDALAARLDDLRGRNLLRELRRVDSPQSAHVEVAGRALLNFSSNDYLGIANHAALKEAALNAIERFGAGAGASRLICGSLAPHHQLEEALAGFKNTEAAITFSSGYATALGTICAVIAKDDIIVLDKLVHASMVDAARLSGARLRAFAHNDVHDLERILSFEQRKLRPAGNPRHILIVTESVFSMDGDHAPLPEIVALKDKFGAWLMVDEAHSTGLYGVRGRGLAEEMGVSDCIEIHMGTLGKALGSAGGFIAGSRRLIDYLVNRARSFVFSTAPCPAAAGAALAGVQLVQSAEGDARRKALWEHVEALRAHLSSGPGLSRSAIIPVLLGDEAVAMQTAAALLERGILVPAIRYPTVRRGSARLRVTVTASHTQDEIRTLANAIRSLKIINHKS